jgi:hypothetical protein
MDALSSWLVPRSVPLYVRTIISLSIVVASVVLFKSSAVEFFRKRNNQLLLTIVITYAACMIGFSGTSGYLDAERYLTVIVPPCMLLVFSFVQEVRSKNDVKAKIFLACFILWTIYPLSRTFYHLLEV